jgi:GTPase SAR1 family protein
MTVFGQIVLGPPGSGKTKYCSIMQEYLNSLGRTTFVINLDPANDQLYYDCQLNIFDLINIQDVMANLNLGPNGALIYCIEFLETNFDWLKENLEKLCKNVNRPYLLFDLPGQVELYTHHNSIKNIIQNLVKLDYRLCSVNLVDSYYASDPAKFISVLLVSLSSMLQTELPHINILSKMDLLERYGKLAFNIDYYTDVLDLNYLVDTLDSDKILVKYKNLNRKICEVIQDYSLVSFITLNIQKKKSILKCIQNVDKANGYLFGHLDDQDLMNSIAANIDAYENEYDEENANENNFMMNEDNEYEE